MTFEEFKTLAKAMKSIWTRTEFLPDKYALKIWYELLKDLPYEQVNIAIQKHAHTNKWPPTPADIREHVVIMQDESTDWGQAWKQLTMAIGRFGTYREGEALESMDELTRETTKRLGWKMICQSEQTELTAIRANFRKIYEQIQSEERDRAKLPQSLQQSIARLTGRELEHDSVHELRSSEKASGMPRSLPGETGRTESKGL